MEGYEMSMRTFDENEKPIGPAPDHNPVIDCTPDGVGRTKQSPAAECDINVLLRKYKQAGELSHISNHLNQYRDLTGTPDLHEAMNIVADANSEFEHLPAEVRAECGHDASNFLPWIDNPDNQDTAEKYGLLPMDLSEAETSSIAEMREAITVPSEPEVPAPAPNPAIPQGSD